MALFVNRLDRLLLEQRTARIVAQDRYEAYATAEVDGPHMAPANGRRMDVPMTSKQRHDGYLLEARRQYLREKAFEEAMLGAGS